MTERIVRQFRPLTIVLFGSYARGEADRHSDVDLLVVLPQVTNHHQTTADILSALADLPVPKDVVVTTPEEIVRWGNFVGMALRPALREGRVLYDAEGKTPPGQRIALKDWIQAGEVCPVDERVRLAETRRWLERAFADLRAAEAAVRNADGASKSSLVS